MHTNLTRRIACTFFFVAAFWSLSPVIAQTASKSFDVKDFTQINMNVPADIYVGSGDFMVKAEAPQEILDRLEITTEGNTLKISMKKSESWSWNSHSTFKIYVNLPKLEALGLNGSGDVYAQNDFSGDQLKIAVTGSGNVNMKSISYNSLAVSVSGSGDVMIESGKATTASYHVAGSGNVKVEKIDGDQASADVAGSGNLRLGKFSKLSVNVAGSGDVSYSGKPESLEKHVSGSGDVYEK
jgi:Putative auto-transporter adhesin, head GIN domain